MEQHLLEYRILADMVITLLKRPTPSENKQTKSPQNPFIIIVYESLNLASLYENVLLICMLHVATYHLKLASWWLLWSASLTVPSSSSLPYLMGNLLDTDEECKKKMFI